MIFAKIGIHKFFFKNEWRPMKINKKSKQIKLVFMTFEKNWSSFHKNQFSSGILRYEVIIASPSRPHDVMITSSCPNDWTTSFSKTIYPGFGSVKSFFPKTSRKWGTIGTCSIIKYVLFYRISIYTVILVVLCAKTWIRSRISMTKNFGEHWIKLISKRPFLNLRKN